MAEHFSLNILVFIVGLVFGSFYNVLALRTSKREKISYPPSHCTECNHKLGYLDLIPVISYLFLLGKCRYCKGRISKLYPIGELLTAISYLVIINKYGFTFEGLIQIIFITAIILMAVTDMKEKLIYDMHLIPGIIVILVLRLIKADRIPYYLLSSIISFGILYLILILSKGKLGGGDVQLYALIGLSLGLSGSVLSFCYASISGTVLNLDKLMYKEKRKEEFAFVPHILIGIVLTYIYNPYAFLGF